MATLESAGAFFLTTLRWPLGPEGLVLLLLLQCFCTFYLCGVIWVVQLVHYPLFNQVGREHFSAYAQRHTRWISPVVAPAMLLKRLPLF
jgi:hypothetical protein